MARLLLVALELLVKDSLVVPLVQRMVLPRLVVVAVVQVPSVLMAPTTTAVLAVLVSLPQ
jgi:hypothetical protein